MAAEGGGGQGIASETPSKNRRYLSALTTGFSKNKTGEDD